MINRLGLPLGTRLEMITRHENGSFRVWTAIKNKQVPPNQYLGTYLELRVDGSVWQCTIRPDGEEEWQVMEPLQRLMHQE